jgi:hypothetical protein
MADLKTVHHTDLVITLFHKRPQTKAEQAAIVEALKAFVAARCGLKAEGFTSVESIVVNSDHGTNVIDLDKLTA